MVFSTYLVSAIAAAGVAFGQSTDKCKPSSTFTVQNQGDASTVGSCTTFTGDISINANAGATLDFGSVGTITGAVKMDSDALLTSLKFSSLTKLGSLELTNITRLATLDLSSLQNVGDLVLKNLAGLNAFSFGTGLSQAGTVNIENVQISDLSGIASASKVGAIVLSNCQFLQKINFNVKEVGIVDIGPNNVVQGQQISFPNLEIATSLTIRNSTTVSTPKLRNVSQTLGLIGNKFTSYGATNLTWVGALVIQSNPSVTNLSFPSLARINGSNSTLDIENNTALARIDGFPKLTEVTTGDAIFAGNLVNISLPALTNVAGAMVVLSTNSSFDCTPITAYQSSQVVKGEVTCRNGDANAIGGTSGTSTSEGASASSKGAASGTELPSFLTTGAFAALLAFLA